MAALQLKLLGGFEASTAAGQSIEISGKKNLALLAFLAVHARRKLPRDKLTGLLWSDRGEQQARSSLRQALLTLRRDLAGIEPNPLLIEGDAVAIDATATSSDVAAFEKLAASDASADLRQAAALYGGDFLDGIAVRDQAFDEWLAVERSRLREIAVGVLGRLIEHLSGAEAVAVAHRLIALDPLREASHCALMGIHAAQGQRDQAIRQYQACREILQRELGVEPSKATEALHRQISEGSYRPLTAAELTATMRETDAPPALKPSLPLPDKPSIAVLPFANLSGDLEQGYFADGLTEDLITDLSKVPDLFVIARNSSFAYKGRSIDTRHIARELGVKYVLEGSARRAAGRVRINAQLIDTHAGGHIWADRFDRDLADVFAAQDEVIGKIVEALVGKLTAASLKERYRPPSLEAYDLCLRGRAEWAHSAESFVEAIPLFEQAIALDPNYAEAYRWLALGQSIGWLHMNRPMDPFRRLSMTSAIKAVELDPEDSGAHWALAFVLLYERRWDESAKEFEVSLRLNPNDSDAWSNLADLKVMEGRGVEAVSCVEKALRLNPAGLYHWDLGQAQYAAGQYEAAVKTLRHEATYRTGSRRFLAAALAQLGRLNEAREEGRLYVARNPHFRISYWVETQPFRDLATRDRFVEGYRKAGLPE